MTTGKEWTPWDPSRVAAAESFQRRLLRQRKQRGSILVSLGWPGIAITLGMSDGTFRAMIGTAFLGLVIAGLCTLLGWTMNAAVPVCCVGVLVAFPLFVGLKIDDDGLFIFIALTTATILSVISLLRAAVVLSRTARRISPSE